MKNYSNWEAFRYFKETLHVLTDMPENEEIKRAQIEVCLLLANPMLHLGFPEDSLEILQTGERLTKELGDEKNLAHFLSLIGQYHAWKGEDLILAIQYSEDSFKEAKKIQDIELMAPIGADLSMLYFWMGEFFKVIDVSSEVIFLLEKTQKQAEFFGRPYNVYAFLLAQHSVCVWRLGNFEEGSALFERGLDFALEIKDLFALSLLELHHGMNHNFKGDAKNALAHLQNSIKYAEEGQNVSFYGVAWIGLGWAYWLRGEVETARSHMEKALKIQMESGIHYDLSFFYAAAGMVDLDCGDLKTAQYRAEQALKTSQKNHQQYGEGMAWILLGRTLGKADVSQIDKAEAWILQGTKILAGLKLVIHSSPGYYFLGELFADIGRLDKALENFKKAVKQFREMGMDYWVTKTHKALDALSDGAGEIRKMA